MNNALAMQTANSKRDSANDFGSSLQVEYLTAERPAPSRVYQRDCRDWPSIKAIVI